MSQVNEIRMTPLDDGAVTIDTGAFTEEVHLSVEQFVNETIADLGGTVTVTQKPHDHKSGHSHVHPTVKNR